MSYWVECYCGKKVPKPAARVLEWGSFCSARCAKMFRPWTEKSETSRTNIEHRGMDRASLEKEVEQLMAMLNGAGSN